MAPKLPSAIPALAARAELGRTPRETIGQICRQASLHRSDHSGQPTLGTLETLRPKFRARYELSWCSASSRTIWVSVCLGTPHHSCQLLDDGDLQASASPAPPPSPGRRIAGPNHNSSFGLLARASARDASASSKLRTVGYSGEIDTRPSPGTIGLAPVAMSKRS